MLNDGTEKKNMSLKKGEKINQINSGESLTLAICEILNSGPIKKLNS